MKHPCLLITVLICFLYVSHAADPVADFSGNWKLDPKSTKVDLAGPENGKLNLQTSGPVTVRESGDLAPPILPASPPLGRIANLRLHIVHAGNEVQIERHFILDGEERSVLQKFSTDGSQCLNLSSDGTGEFVSRSSWKKNKLIHSGIQTLRMQHETVEAHVTEEYSISKNGEKLTFKTMSTMPQGSIKLKQEFRKQENGNS